MQLLTHILALVRLFKCQAASEDRESKGIAPFIMIA